MIWNQCLFSQIKGLGCNYDYLTRIHVKNVKKRHKNSSVSTRQKSPLYFKSQRPLLFLFKATIQYKKVALNQIFKTNSIWDRRAIRNDFWVIFLEMCSLVSYRRVFKNVLFPTKMFRFFEKSHWKALLVFN